MHARLATEAFPTLLNIPPTKRLFRMFAEPDTSNGYAGFDLKTPNPAGVQYAIPVRLLCLIAKFPPYPEAALARHPPYHQYKTGPSVLVKLLL
jgi:hypothetical protein